MCLKFKKINTNLFFQAVKIREHHVNKAIDDEHIDAPKRQTFYQKHLEHMFKEDRYSSSSDEEERENEKNEALFGNVKINNNNDNNIKNQKNKLGNRSETGSVVSKKLSGYSPSVSSISTSIRK